MDYELIIKIVSVAILAYFVVNFMNKTPKYNRVDEGFYGGVVRGSGHPDCLRTLPEASQLLDLFDSHNVNLVPAGQSDASADYNELKLLLSKMACLKKDLLSPNGVVDSTRYQAFETAHDRVAVAELCGLCMSQNIPQRDLDIIFMTWRDRGKELLRRLCTSANLSEMDSHHSEVIFKKAYDEVYNVATSRCIKTDYSKQNGGHTLGDVGAFEPPTTLNLRTYDYNYEGLSASGWNGA